MLDLLARLLLGVALGTLVAHFLIPAETAKTPAGMQLSLFYSMICMHGVSLLVIVMFLRDHGMGWVEAFGFSRPGLGRAIGLSLGTVLVIVPFTWFLSELSVRAMQVVQVKPVAQTIVQTLQKTETFDARLYLAVAAILVAPVVEEILFRGIFYAVIKQRGFPRLAFWGTSILFGLTHANAMTFIPLTVFAMALAWLYERTDNLLAPILTHSLFNLINFLFLMNAQKLTKIIPGAS